MKLERKVGERRDPTGYRFPTIYSVGVAPSMA